MQAVVKVTRRGQTTIPIKFRKKFGIKEGNELLVELAENGMVFMVIPKIEELAGVDAKYGKVEEIKQEIEKLREEY
ncbi:MAG: AbrB/MazE/SpoVT family DNA-binding domain-containing protein [Candidatus Bathyarchaeia archaeon]